MISVRFSTHEQRKSRQLELWRSWYDGSFEVTAPDAPDRGFAGKIEVWKLNSMALASVSAPKLRAIRPKSLIKRDPTDHWVITIGRATTDLILEKDQLSIPAGVPFVLSMGDSFASQRDGDSRLQLSIARDNYSALALDAARGRAVSTPLGGMLAEYIKLLERELPSLTDEDARNLPQAIVAMVAACVAPTNDRMTTAREQISATLKDKARRCILENLRSHRLGADMLCRELGLSRSSLYRLLESEGGVTQYIQRLRLSESLAQLSNPSNRKPIAILAYELGMVDPSAFSRAFRRQFGISPTDAREAAQAGLVPPIAQTLRDAWNGIGGLLARL
jgi:AraC-like DNA-binding protein